MALVLADRVREGTNTAGTGTVTLTGAVTGFASFADQIGNGNTTYYTITDGTSWEVGVGTYNAGTLSRDTILDSSTGSLINFAAGFKDVFVTLPAEKVASTDTLGSMSTQNANAVAITGGAINGTSIGATTRSSGDFTTLSANAVTSTTPVLSFNASNSIASFGSTTPNSYNQLVIQNKSGTTGASTNYVISNNLGTDSTYYGEFGMNASTYSSGTPSDFFSLNNGVYFSSHDGDVTVGSGNGYKTFLAWGTAGDKAHVVNASGAIGLNTNITGTTNFGTSGQVLTSAGSAAAPAWSNAPTLSGATIDNTPIGGTTPAAGTFTTLSANGTLTAQTEVLKGTGQNYLRYSEQFQNGVWTSFGTVTVTADTQVAPDGNTTADTLAFSSSSGLYQIFTGIGLTTYTFSIYLKAASATSVSVVINTNLSDPVTVVASVTTSWQRFTVSKTTSSGTSSVTAQLQTGGSSSTVYAWGAQVELGSGANTYVPTTTTAVYGTPTLSFSGVAGLGLQSDGSLYVSPAGTGALQAQATTSTATGGNARGANAVDWQTNRDTAAKIASGTLSVVGGGYANVSSGYASVISGGFRATSSGTESFVGAGNSNTSSGNYSAIVSGYSNTASGLSSFIGAGLSNTTAGYYNFVGGGFTNSGTSGSAVTTQSGTMNATTAVTLSGSNGNIKVGQYITGTSIADDTYVAAISGTSLTLSKNASGSSTSTLSFYTPHGVVVGGGNNQATGSYSFIGGGGDAGTAANRLTASGDWSVAVGGRGNVASGIASFVGGGGTTGDSNNNKNTASGTTAVIGGGAGNNATGNAAAILGGQNNTASGEASTVVGGFYGTTRGIGGNIVIGSDVPIAYSQGVAQAASLVIGKQTTDATPTVLTSNQGTGATNNQVILPNNSAYYFRGTVVAGVTGGGNTKGWYIEGVIKRGAGVGTTALVGTPTVMSSYADVGAATWALTATADTTNGGLAITFTGQAATTIRVVAKLETTEMTF